MFVTTPEFQHFTEMHKVTKYAKIQQIPSWVNTHYFIIQAEFKVEYFVWREWKSPTGGFLKWWYPYFRKHPTQPIILGSLIRLTFSDFPRRFRVCRAFSFATSDRLSVPIPRIWMVRAYMLSNEHMMIIQLDPTRHFSLML